MKIMNTVQNDRKSIKKFMIAESAILVGLGLVCGVEYSIRTGDWLQALEVLCVGIAVLSGTMLLMYQRAIYHLQKCDLPML
jgi:hypothetical protein